MLFVKKYQIAISVFKKRSFEYLRMSRIGGKRTYHPFLLFAIVTDVEDVQFLRPLMSLHVHTYNYRINAQNGIHSGKIVQFNKHPA